MEQSLKTGAIVCRKSIPGTEQLEYEALEFISGIPHHMTDELLAHLLKERIKVMNAHECKDILVRADINATGNEVWEQFEGLNNDSGKAPVIPFSSL